MKGATLVVGATGATGKHVVQQLLNQQRPVHVIVRSKERMLSALQDDSKANTLLTITEASLLDLTDEQIQEHVNQADNVVSCLGHNMTFQGMFGDPQRLVAESVERLATALAQTTGTRRKLIVMNTVGVANPDGSDDKRLCWERCVLLLCRYFLADNQAVATYLHNMAGTGNMEWVVVRPTDLINGDATKYKLFDKPPGAIFKSGVATRANVAKFMVDLVTDDALFADYKFRMPVINDETQPSDMKDKNSKQN